MIDSVYLTTLGSYRFFYLIHWIVQGIGEGRFDPISVIFGTIQTTLYIDFAWVYWSRQRVKLRGGGVVDSDDLSKSFLVRRFIGKGTGNSEDDDDAEDVENGTARPPAQRWGARGVSVSADDTLAEHDRANIARRNQEQMADPAAFEDEEEDAVADASPPPAKDQKANQAQSLVHESDEEGVGSSAGEWQENAGGR